MEKVTPENCERRENTFLHKLNEYYLNSGDSIVFQLKRVTFEDEESASSSYFRITWENESLSKITQEKAGIIIGDGGEEFTHKTIKIDFLDSRTFNQLSVIDFEIEISQQKIYY